MANENGYKPTQTNPLNPKKPRCHTRRPPYDSFSNHSGSAKSPSRILLSNNPMAVFCTLFLSDFYTAICWLLWLRNQNGGIEKRNKLAICTYSLETNEPIDGWCFRSNWTVVVELHETTKLDESEKETAFSLSLGEWKKIDLVPVDTELYMHISSFFPSFLFYARVWRLIIGAPCWLWPLFAWLSYESVASFSLHFTFFAIILSTKWIYDAEYHENHIYIDIDMNNIFSREICCASEQRSTLE